MRSHAYAEMCEDMRIFEYIGIISAYAILKTQLYVEKYVICGFCNICDRMCDRMFSYNRYPYNCASVQRALLAPEILNESFLKCRYLAARTHQRSFERYHPGPPMASPSPKLGACNLATPSYLRNR